MGLGENGPVMNASAPAVLRRLEGVVLIQIPPPPQLTPTSLPLLCVETTNTDTAKSC